MQQLSILIPPYPTLCAQEGGRAVPGAELTALGDPSEQGLLAAPGSTALAPELSFEDTAEHSPGHDCNLPSILVSSLEIMASSELSPQQHL